MQKNGIPATAFADTKPHYELLDGLRGVAALLVVFYHIFEGLSFAAGGTVITVINHGYMAVDFFFILSGFVIGYAYDDRIGKTMSLGNFFKRRLIRLHPMIVIGAVIGAVAFCMQGSVRWDGTKVATSMVMLALLCSMFFIPAVPGARHEVRGNGEMFPLNGPSWSLFFEYIGNLSYALFIHRLPTKALAVLAGMSGISLAVFALSDVSGCGVGVGWTLDGVNFAGGFLRMLFPFTMGMLMSRRFRPMRVRGAFWICSAALLLLFCVPYIEGRCGAASLNGLYEAACILAVFPVLVWVGASGRTDGRRSAQICKFLGDISYPLYAVHYPLMYLFYAWLIDNRHHAFGEAWPVALAVYAGSILLARLCQKYYDEPVRRWLAKKLMGK